MPPGVLEPPPSRLFLTLAGGLTQALGLAYLILGVAALPIAHELRGGTQSVIVSIVAALATIVCGNLVYRGRMIPIALAVGLDVGFGIALAHGTTAIGALLHILPKKSDPAAQTLAKLGSFAMFVAAGLCVLAIPVALRLRVWARQGLESAPSAGNSASDDNSQATSTGDKVEQTLKGVGATRAPVTQIIHRRKQSKSAIIIIVSATLIAIGVVVTTIGSGPSTSEVINMATTDSLPAALGSGSAAPGKPLPSVAHPQTPPEPSVPPPVPSINDFISHFHAALGDPAPDALSHMLDPNVFGFGVSAHDVAQGRASVVAMLRENIGAGPTAHITVAGYYTKTGSDGDVGWFGEELRVGKTTYTVSAAAGLRDGAWTIFALHCALAMPNETAHELAYHGQLEIPDSIPNGRTDTPLAKVMMAAFASRTAFVASRSARPDSYNFGSAPGERSAGESTTRIFSQLKAKIRHHDAVNVGAIGEHGGWGAANVDYTDADSSGHEVRQTFRVLVVWLLEDDNWRMVQTQWSNGR